MFRLSMPLFKDPLIPLSLEAPQWCSPDISVPNAASLANFYCIYIVTTAELSIQGLCLGDNR
jgi:hypothetical protein